ncbi:MAG: DNA topoisomerase 4 subunit A [Oscillospiraceae bacterium]|jgi:DNA gyrase subunit A|nr:DNA topoisomerase 4 subunit A [Oscillospiraceae bacterium]
MPKRPVKPPTIPETPGERIQPAGLEDVLRDAMIPYAEHVILDRALPRVEDGLKPVQRRILYTMLELGLSPDKPHRKSVRIVGDCLGKFHPHGDSSVYDAMVRLAQPYAMRAPLVDGHGNFGSIDNDSAAAMRYTEARLTPLAMEMLRDLEKDTVPLRLNFDDTLKEPEILPSRYPNLLVNGSSGIAVGLATNIPPHNLGEAIAAVIARIDKPGMTLDELMNIMPGPDFPTGGQLLKTDEIRAAYQTGRAKIQLRARAHIEDASAGRKQIVITEMPYQIAKAALLEKILKASEEKRSLGTCIHDIRDESDRDGLRAVVELKREADPARTLALLYKYTDLQITFGVNIFVIADGKPRQMGLLGLIDAYIEHQKRVLTRRIRYDLEKARARAHILEGLIRAVDCLDEIIALIRSSRDAKEAKRRLVERFQFTEIQAQAILDLRLQRLTGLEILELRGELDQLRKQIDKLQSILTSESKLRKLIQSELSDIAKRFANPRRTEIIAPPNDIIEEAPEQPEAEPTRVLITRGGAVKRLPVTAKGGGIGRDKAQAETPSLSEMPLARFDTKMDDILLLFTNVGNMYRLPVSSLPEAVKPRDRGANLSALLAGLEENEAVVRALCVRAGDGEAMPDLLFVTRRGMIKRTAFQEYRVRKSKIVAIKLRVGDELAAVLELREDMPQMLLMVSIQGMALLSDPASIEPSGRISAGVIGMRFDPRDQLLDALLIPPGEGELLIMTDRAYAKRILVADFEPQSRGGKGARCISFGKSGADGTRLAQAMHVTNSYDVGAFTGAGLCARLSTQEVPLASRSGRGHAAALIPAERPIVAVVPLES